MWMMKRWIALMLAMAVVISDCGGITVFAAENATEVDNELISEDETIESEDADVSPEDESNEADEETNLVDEDADLMDEDTDSDTDTETEFPALHIGQIKEGEELPSPDDSKFVYDLPVSFEMSDSVLLFVNYDIDTTLETEERGTLVWSILRGEKGLKEGSASLVKEEDDWAGFEVVSDSPYFTMTENDDEENAYYQAMLITAKDVIDHENNEDDKNSEDYNYYIRAAWYFGTEEEMDEDFYAAATIAFLPQEDTDIDEAQDDMIDTEEVDTDQIQDDEPVTEETVEEALDDALSEEEIDMDNALEDIGAERVGSEIFESDEQQDSNKDSRKLILDITKETMKPGETQQVNVTIESEDIQEDTQEDDQEEPQEDPSVDLLEKIVWASSNKSVATVEKGLITAEAEGYAQITAQYDGLTASVKIEVVQEENEKVLNLDGDIWIAGFKQESDDFVYTGQKITQDIRVYYDETLLQEKTDYTVTYKNNVNAAAYNSAKAPSMTIKLKGQYSGSRTLYFTIKPREIDENKTMGYEQVVPYAKTLKIPAPTLYYNNKKLASGKDFVCDYTAYDESSAYKKMPADYKKGDSYEAGEIYEYTVNGAGNFTGSFKMQLVVVKDKNLNLANASVTLEKKQYEYRGKELTKAEVEIAAVKFGKVELAKEYYNYEVHAAGVGTGYIEITPTKEGRDNGYRGLKKVNFKVVGDRQIKDAKIKEAVIEKGVIVEDGWHSSITFSQKSVNEDGGMIQTAAEVLVYVEPSDAGDSLEEGSGKEVVLEEGKDYTVKYSNHKKVGTATATFTGKGRYKGTLKLKYQITPNIKEENFTIVWNNVKKNVTEEGVTFEMAYQKGGAVPNFVLMDQDKNVLKNKTDYTVTLRDNKTPGTAMICEINGKGNYKGYQASKSIMVTNADISKGTLTVADKPANGKANAWKSNPTIKDVNGKKLVAGTDYKKEFDYTNTKTKEEITSYPEAGTEVTVTVHGINNYEGSIITGTYRIYKTSISKLKITIDAQEYTGKEITLTPIKDIHVYANSFDQKKKRNEIFEDYYKIIEYKNNIKAGTAKVTLQGIGEYGGTKTYSFKIKKKTYLINQVKGITLDKTSIALSIQGKDDDKRILKATIKSADETEPLANPTVIWSTSNSNIAAVEGGDIVVTKTNTGKYETTVTAHIILKKEGSVTITATAQDGGKKAKCTVTIVDVPILEDADGIIEIDVGDTYKLRFENDDIQKPNLSGITWTISNSDVVSVDKEKGIITAEEAGAVMLKLTKGKYVQRCYVVVGGEEEDVPDTYLRFTQPPGSKDDTEDIRNCIKKANHTKNGDGTFKYDGVYIPAGVYWIDATANANCGIFLDGRDPSVTWDPLEARDSFEVRMSPGALLMTIGNSESSDFHVIKIEGCSNITISGGTIIGERNEHSGKSGESGHGIGIYDCTNIHIQDMDISQCWGDGIYLGRSYKSTADNKDIDIRHCNVHDNRRNNLSITSANGVTIDDCKFNNAKGKDPQFGIDIETNIDSKPCKNITISNTKMIGNAKASMGIITPAENVRLEYCTLDKNFYNKAGKNVVLYQTTVKGEIVGVVDIK